MWVIGKAGIEHDVEKLKEKIGRFFILDGNKPDAVIALGGEGTLFRAVKEYPDSATLPVRKSSFGALSQVNEQNVMKALERISKGKYFIENIMRLEVNFKGFKAWGINDISVLRDDENANRFRIFSRSKDIFGDDLVGDGVVCATPHGSTGYSWTAGGVILRSNEKKFVITPICSVYFNKRMAKAKRNVMKRAESKVFPYNKEIFIRFSRNIRNKIVVDGRQEERFYADMKAGDEVNIRVSRESSKLLQI